MAKKLSNDYRIWIDSEVPGTPAEIKGNQSLSISRSSSPIDTSTKDDFPYGTAAPGLRSVSVAGGFVPNLPDANGWERVEDVANAAVATPVKIQIRKGGASGAAPADVVFECSMYVTIDSTNMDQNTPLSATVTFTAAAAPTIDTLA